MRHFTTFIVVIGVLWVVAKPHAEKFVNEAVNERIENIEYKVDYVVKQLNRMSIQIDRLQRETL